MGFNVLTPSASGICYDNTKLSLSLIWLVFNRTGIDCLGYLKETEIERVFAVLWVVFLFVLNFTQ